MKRALRIAAWGSVPAVLLVLYVYGAALADTARARAFDDWWSRPRGVYHFTGYRVRALASLPQRLSLRRRLDGHRSPDALRLDVPRAEWNRIGSDPQAAFGRDLPAAIVEDDTEHAVQVRVRGDTSVHWLTDKVSFTVRTPDERPWRGHRRLAFSCKLVLPQQLTATLAGEFGLLAPDSAALPVYLGGSFHGIYRFLELVDEAFLRRHGRLPGNVLRGDTAERGEVFKNVPRELFRNPYLWDLVASDGGPTERERARLEALVRDLHDGSPAARERLWAQFDRDEIARLLAFLLVVGDSYHMSDIHNQFWYRDPSDGKLHPIPWDVYVRPLDEPISAFNLLLKELLRDPEVLEDALRHAWTELEERGLLARVERIARDADRRHADAFAFDRLRAGAVSDVGSPDEIVAVVARNAALLRRWAGDAHFAFCSGRGADGWHVLDLVSGGLAGCDLRSIAVVATGGAPELRLDRNRDGRLDDGDPAVPVRLEARPDGARVALERAVPLLAGTDPEGYPLRPTTLHYRLFLRLPGVPAETAVLRPELRNRITGAAVEAGPLERREPLFDGRCHHPWERVPARAPRTTRLRGEVRLERTLLVEPGDRLVIEPGTTVRLADGASILARGRLEAEGRADAPIAFVPDGAGPWGTVALLGGGADGSSLRACRFTGGAGATVEGVAFEGMVSVHRARGVVLSACELTAHERGEDALGAVHAELTVERCVFTGGAGDAIDLDVSSGTIRGCRIEAPGNDAIDLMTSDARILANDIRGAGDKGVSVGEASSPLIFGNRIRDCRRGIEVRDRSRPVIAHNEITGCRTGLLQQPGDWRHGAGALSVVARTAMHDNQRDRRSDPRSVLVSVDDEPAAELLTRCLLAGYGVRAGGSAPGPAVPWAEDPASRRLAWVDVRPRVGDGRAGWRASGSRGRPRALGDDVALELGSAPAAMEHDVDWDARDPGVRHVALLQLTPVGCTSVEVEVEHAGGAVTARLEAAQRGGGRLLAVELEPARYSALRVTAAPAGEDGRLVLHGYGWYALSR